MRFGETRDAALQSGDVVNAQRFSRHLRTQRSQLIERDRHLRDNLLNDRRVIDINDAVAVCVSLAEVGFQRIIVVEPVASALTPALEELIVILIVVFGLSLMVDPPFADIPARILKVALDHIGVGRAEGIGIAAVDADIVKPIPVRFIDLLAFGVEPNMFA